MTFLERVNHLPLLGIGVSTEYGAHASQGALDVTALRREHPLYAGFLEVGTEVSKGLDEAALSWVAQGGRTTYHFLDVNLEDTSDQDARWLEGLEALTAKLQPEWLCGDAGLWHFGDRERAHMTLLPPILCDDSAEDMAHGVRALREASGYEVLPENPPGHLYLGDLHLLDYFGRVLERGDTGMLLDCAHLAIYQRLCGHEPLTALDGFPLDRVVELHVAGGVERERNGFHWVEDDHTPEVLPDTWEIFDHVIHQAPNLKAVVFECERNSMESCLEGFERIAQRWKRGGDA